MEQSNTIILENNKEYNIVNKLIYNNIEYVLLSNVADVKDICIRKILTEDQCKYICRLDSDELNTVFNKFINENKTPVEKNN